MTKAIVTGGAGFIGAHVCNELVKMGCDVVAVDDLSGGLKDNVNPQACFVEGSILDNEFIDRLFRIHQFDYVYHLAAYAAEGLSHFIRRFNYSNNVIGSMNLINAAVKYRAKCFVYTSSIAVYGNAASPVREDMALVPEDPYGIAKLSVEHDLRVCYEMFGLPYIIFRPHNVYGEYQNIGDKYRNVVGIFMNQLMQGKELTIFGDGSQTRAFSYIGDIAKHIANAVFVPKAYNEIMNIGADDVYSINHLADEVIQAMGGVGKKRHVEARNEVMHAFADHTKARDILGFETHVPLREGLRNMAAWVKRVGVQKSKTFKHIELYQNLPPVWLETQ